MAAAATPEPRFVFSLDGAPDWLEVRSSNGAVFFPISRFCAAISPTGSAGGFRVFFSLHSVSYRAAPPEEVTFVDFGTQKDASDALYELKAALLARGVKSVYSMTKGHEETMFSVFDASHVVDVLASKEGDSSWKVVAQCCEGGCFFTSSFSGPDSAMAAVRGIATAVAACGRAARSRAECDCCKLSLEAKGGGVTFRPEGAKANSALCHQCVLDAALANEARMTPTAEVMKGRKRAKS